MKIIPSLCLLVLLVKPARAADMEQAKHELAGEAVACATFYGYAVALSQKSGYSLGPKAENAVGSALTLANSLTTAPKVRAMIDLQKQQQKKVLDEQGFARLMVTYLDSCNALLDDPAGRLKYWLGR